MARFGNAGTSVLLTAFAGAILPGASLQAQSWDVGLFRLELAHEVGVLDQPDSEQFGQISAVEPGDSGSFYVFDRLRGRISLFDSAGEFVGNTGRKGQGPGEFAHAGGLAFDKNSRELIATTLDGRITTYTASESEFRMIEAKSLGVGLDKLCLLNDALYVATFREGYLIHDVSRTELTITRSFGEPFSDDPVLGATLALGLITCVPDQDVILFAELRLPFLRSYTADGILRWEIPIDGFLQHRITRTPTGVLYRGPENGELADMVVSVLDLGSGLALVQFGKLGLGLSSLEEIVQVQSRFYSIETGAELLRTDELPRLDAVGADGLAYSKATHSYPQVRVYRYSIRNEEVVKAANEHGMAMVFTGERLFRH